MISRLFKSRNRAEKAPPPPGGTPPSTVIWAVGDVHGRLDLLEPLIDAMIVDLDRSQASRRVLVFLGDYIDRGPQSREVLDRLIALSGDDRFETRFLAGNHEEKMLEFLDRPSVGRDWCTYGGVEALASYGLKPPAMRHMESAWAALSGDFAHRLPEAHKSFLRDLETSVSLGGYFFCHAGARPGVPLDQQDDHDLRWIRGTFLNDVAPFEQVVVHGHTPAAEVHVDHRRIGVDTGAYQTGVLSAVRLEGEGVEIMQARDEGEVVTLLRTTAT